jgi:hypothetical protein
VKKFEKTVMKRLKEIEKDGPFLYHQESSVKRVVRMKAVKKIEKTVNILVMKRLKEIERDRPFTKKAV